MTEKYNLLHSLLRAALCALFCAAIMLGTSFDSHAASASLSFSDPSGKVGETISVNVKISADTALGNTDIMLAYDALTLEFANDTENASGGVGAVRVWTAPEGKTEQVTVLHFKALKPGVTAINVTSEEAYDSNGGTLEFSKIGSSTVTVAALATSSSDATLKDLLVSPGYLVPTFTPATEEYTISVGLDADALTVSAVPNNAGATVAVNGASELHDGENNISITVTADDGTTQKTYSILLTRSADAAAENTGAETADAAPTVLTEYTATAKKIRIIELPEGVEVPNGLTSCKVTIADVSVTGWIRDGEAMDSAEYCVVYAMNENDEADFYRIDLSGKTLQRYFDDIGSGYSASEYESLENELDDMTQQYELARIIALAFIILVLVLFIVIIVMFVSFGHTGGRKNVKMESYIPDSDADGEMEQKAAEEKLPEVADPVKDDDAAQAVDNEKQLLAKEIRLEEEKIGAEETELAQKEEMPARDFTDGKEEDFDFFDLE